MIFENDISSLNTTKLHKRLKNIVMLSGLQTKRELIVDCVNVKFQ